MNRQMKKYIILFFVILIPLLATFLIGSYGYNSEKFGQGAWKNEYKEEYLSFSEEETTANKIDKYLKYGINPQYYVYGETPVFSQTLQVEGKNLFQLDIYRTIYKASVKSESGDDFVEEDRVQFLFLIYDVQYQNIRDLYTGGDATLRKEINEANVPNISIKLTEIIEDEEETPKTLEVTITEFRAILDKGADFDTVKGEVLEDDDTNSARRLAIVLGTVKMEDLEWSAETEVEIKANFAGIADPEEEGKDISVLLSDFELDMSPKSGDISNYVNSYQQDLAKIGYFNWVFKNYLWWIGLITLIATGLITFSFYGVYLAEEQETKKKIRKKRVRR